jgi:hypothetical protein
MRRMNYRKDFEKFLLEANPDSISFRTIAMNASRARIVRATRILLLAVGALIAHQATASAQYGFGGIGYGGMGYGGMGYGGMGYGGMGYGGMGYGGMGYGGMGYGGMGYGGGYGGYGGFGGIGVAGYGGLGYGYGGYGGIGNVYNSFGGAGWNAGVGYPGIGWRNPYFSFGLSPLVVQNAIFERNVLGRTTPPLQSSLTAAPKPVAKAPAGQVGMGTFSNPR